MGYYCGKIRENPERNLQDSSKAIPRGINKTGKVHINVIQGEHKNTLISSSYKTKTYRNIFINMGLQIH